MHELDVPRTKNLSFNEISPQTIFPDTYTEYNKVFSFVFHNYISPF